jgi:hypothetical protein
MSGSATDALGVEILGHTLGITAMPLPPAPWVGLCLAAIPPTNATGGGELGAGGGYARVQAVFALDAGGAPIADNQATVTFPAASADWGSIGFFELWDAATGGNRNFWGGLIDPTTGLATTRTILSGDQARFSPGTLVITVNR